MRKTKAAHKAHSAVAYAVKTGKLIKPASCEQCGADKPLEAAHHDYAQPLQVRWLCRTCHRSWDKDRPKGGTVKVTSAAPSIRLAHCGPPEALVAGLSAPSVRLALVHSESTEAVLQKPDIRLALAGGQAERNNTLEKPDVRLAVTGSVTGQEKTVGADKYPFHVDAPEPLAPALLVSYYYLKPFQGARHRYHFRDWVMDSGAFSAHNSGVTINLQEYIDTCKRLLDEDDKLTEVFALDDIGSWQAGLHNTEEMWKQGVEAIPTFHPGKEPWDLLKGYAKDYPKIALGGVVGMPAKQKKYMVEQCFARVWPCKIHGLGMSGENMVMSFPFHSVDASNWELGPCRFGNWKTFGDMSVRGSTQNLRCEVEWHLNLEAKARQKWKPMMDSLGWNAPSAST
jgi:hypothetical protein